MPDEVRIQSQGPNGNGLSLDLKERRLGLTGPNVALLLLILIIGGVAYYRTGTMEKAQRAVQDQIAAAEDRQHTRVSELFGRIDKLIDDLGAQNLLLNHNNTKVTDGQHALQTHVDTALREQDDRTNAKIEAVRAVMVDLKQYTEAWFTELATREALHDWNTLHPDKALPLRGTTRPQEERQPERGR